MYMYVCMYCIVLYCIVLYCIVLYVCICVYIYIYIYIYYTYLAGAGPSRSWPSSSPASSPNIYHIKLFLSQSL